MKDDFPEDIIPLLLSYAVHHFTDLIYYRQINHTWKRICEGSSEWLRIDLSFQPPRNYLLQYPDQLTVQDLLAMGKLEVVNIEEESEEDEENEEQLATVARNERRRKHICFIPFLQPQTHFPQKLQYVITPGTSRAVTPNEIQAWFIPLYLRYQQYWHFHITWKRYFLAMQAKLERIPWWCYAGLFLFPIVMLTLAMMSFEGSSLNEWWLGFVYLESVIVFYGVVLLVLAVSQIIYYYFFRNSMHLNITVWEIYKYFSWVSFCYILCVLLMVIFTHWKVLSGETSIISSWSCIPLPLWILTICYTVAIFSVSPGMVDSAAVFLLCVLFFLPISITCLTFAMDNLLTKEIAFFLFLIVTLPVIVLLMIVPMIPLVVTISEWRQRFQSITQHSLPWLIFPIIIRIIAIGMSCVFLFVLVVSLADSYNYIHNKDEENRENIPLRLTNLFLYVLNCFQIFLWILGIDSKIQQQSVDQFGIEKWA